MLLGIVADTHDNLPMTERAAKLLAGRGTEIILHAGDFVAPFALKALIKPGVPVIGVFGNNDGERNGLLGVCSDLHRPPHRLELGGRTVVLAHDPAALEEEVRRGADLVVHGHTHEVGVSDGPPLAVNPGEAGGWLTGRCTVGLVDLDRMQAEIIELGSQETVEL